MSEHREPLDLAQEVSITPGGIRVIDCLGIERRFALVAEEQADFLERVVDFMGHQVKQGLFRVVFECSISIKWRRC